METLESAGIGVEDTLSGALRHRKGIWVAQSSGQLAVLVGTPNGPKDTFRTVDLSEAENPAGTVFGIAAEIV